MPLWRQILFMWMFRNADTATDFFKLPTNRVVELGTQVEVWLQGRLTVRGRGKRPLLIADGDQRRRQGAVGGAQRRDADREHRIPRRARSGRQRRRDSLSNAAI
jgi:hypothetical protein